MDTVRNVHNSRNWTDHNSLHYCRNSPWFYVTNKHAEAERRASSKGSLGKSTEVDKVDKADDKDPFWICYSPAYNDTKLF